MMPDTNDDPVLTPSDPPPSGSTRRRVTAPPDASDKATPPPPEPDPESAEALAAGRLAPPEPDFADDDLSDLLPGAMPAPRPSARAGLNTEQALPAPGQRMVIHVVEDGFTAHGRTWYRGQELEYVIGEQPHLDTVDRNGETWLTYGDAEQYRRYGRVMFRRGPWPGTTYEDPRAADQEAQRPRQPPALPTLMPGRAV